MGFGLILGLTYTAIAGFSVYMTCREQRQQDAQSRLFNALGYLMCVLWPLALVAMLIAANLARRRRGTGKSTEFAL